MTTFKPDRQKSCYSNLIELMKSFKNKDLTGKKIDIKYTEEVLDGKYMDKCWEVTFGANNREVTIIEITSITTGNVIRKIASINDLQNKLFGCPYFEAEDVVVNKAYKQLKSLHNRCKCLTSIQ